MLAFPLRCTHVWSKLSMCCWMINRLRHAFGPSSLFSRLRCIRALRRRPAIYHGAIQHPRGLIRLFWQIQICTAFPWLPPIRSPCCTESAMLVKKRIRLTLSTERCLRE
ncbi:hypothetical protein BO71DRAFT_249340 [Aspergillus ellipticus CBS 707.79]|uniref:Uncharacterized protein n=1 Tax=Aspergillus ellipticus CBS 707.79 TaxID=1448320 RepID=A0A319DI59_9EURO|nr:hypothetical protein BO71DRAFT_249340 [Aspergillus ellipticus CBS 707.79]